MNKMVSQVTRVICMYHDWISSWGLAFSAQKYLTRQKTAALISAKSIASIIK